MNCFAEGLATKGPRKAQIKSLSSFEDVPCYGDQSGNMRRFGALLASVFNSTSRFSNLKVLQLLAVISS
jgi:hypothetical protein